MDEGALDRLLGLEGVVAAAEFGSDGTLVGFKSTLDLVAPAQDLATRLSAKINETFDQLAETYASMTDMEWLPRRYWCYSGGDFTVAVGGNWMVFAETAASDPTALFRALSS